MRPGAALGVTVALTQTNHEASGRDNDPEAPENEETLGETIEEVTLFEFIRPNPIHGQ